MLPNTERNLADAPADALADALASHGQSHVLRHAAALSPAERKAFLAQLAEVDLPLVARLVRGGEDAKTDYAAVSRWPGHAPRLEGPEGHLSSDGRHRQAALPRVRRANRGR
jgi:hypothetical protein